MKYFAFCHTAEELKKAYRAAAKRLHPDAGGDPEEFKRMQAAFESTWARLKNIHQTKDGKTYEAETTETAGEFMDLIERLLKLSCVDVEICGSWIWCSGNTKPHKAMLKQLGFRWSAGKSAWYYHRNPYRKRSQRELTMEEIRGMYGSRHYDQEQEPQLALQE